MSVVRESCVVKFPGKAEDMGIFAACGCGFQTGAGTILNVLKPEKDESVVIFGMGSVGLTALMGAKYLGLNQIIVVDLIESRLNLAKELGATHVVNAKDHPEIAKHIVELTGGGASYCIDCTGVPKVIESTIDCIGPNWYEASTRPKHCTLLIVLSTAVSVGMAPAGSKVSIEPAMFMLQSKRFIGCTEGGSITYEVSVCFRDHRSTTDFSVVHTAFD
jgi:Zn-dependent alcohol dehydrogenase